MRSRLVWVAWALAIFAAVAALVPSNIVAQPIPAPGTAFAGGTVTSPIKFPDGAFGAPSITFAADADTGFYRSGSGSIGFSGDGTLRMLIGAYIALGTSTLYSGATPGSTATALSYAADGVWKTDDLGNAVPSWIQQKPARSFLAADYTNATTTFSNTALSITVKTGRKYSFVSALFVADSTANEGGKLDFNGGTATATNFVATCILSNAAGTPLTQVAATTAALATPLNIASYTDTAIHQYVCNGSLEPSGNGTFIIRGAQNSHTTGTLTVKRGSYIQIEDMP